jgi:uncharacterized protein
MSDAFDPILEHVDGLEIIDTHEHLPGREELRERPTDVLREYVMQYFPDDLLSSGLSREDLERVRDISRPLVERWRIVAPHWEACRHTGYGRMLDIAARDLHGVDGVRGETLEALDASFQRSLEPGWFRHVLRERCKIRISVLDSNLDCDPDLFRSVWRLDKFVLPRTGQDIDGIERETGIKICALDDWMDACEVHLDAVLERGAVGIKTALAYMRPLRFERVTHSDADRDFIDLFRHRHFPDWEPEVFTIGRDFQDFMFHHLLRLANQRGLTFQIHTGLHAGNGNHIAHSDPTLLTNLFCAYPDVTFDLFHIGYPYEHTLSVLAKNHPNVFIDMCWAHIISPTASINALVEWLDAVPVTKICAFGGDLSPIDLVHGHARLARANVSRALAIKVEEGLFDVGRAQEIARLLFWDNPLRMLQLEGKV